MSDSVGKKKKKICKQSKMTKIYFLHVGVCFLLSYFHFYFLEKIHTLFSTQKKDEERDMSKLFWHMYSLNKIQLSRKGV